MTAPQRPLMFYLIIGLLHGVVWSTLSALEVFDSAAAQALGTAVATWAISLQLLGPQGVQRGTGVLTLGLGLLLAALAAYDHVGLEAAAVRNAGWLGMFVLGYILLAFLLAWPQRQGLRPRYQDLFRHAWNNGFILILALGLTGVFWWLLWLCGQLFEVVGIVWIKQVLEHRVTAPLVLPVVFSLGMRIGLQHERVIGLLRGMMLGLCRFLLPLSAVIIVLFTLVLPFTGIQPIWATGKATAILLLLTACNLFLVNGVFQDGGEGDAYPRQLRRLANASLLCLPVLVGLAAWSSGLRIAQYGLTPTRIQAGLLIGMMLLHALAAAWAVLTRRGAWLHRLRLSNPWLALLAALLIVAYQTPLLDPLGLSARSQVARVLDGRTPVADFDAYTLYLSWGEPGRQAFDALSEQVEKGVAPANAEVREALRQRLAEARELSSERSPAEPALTWLGAPAVHAEAFTAKVVDEYVCRRGCDLWAVDMDGDGRDEVLVIARQRHTASLPLYAWRDGAWGRVGNYIGNTAESGLQTLADRIRRGEVRPVTPRYKTLALEAGELDFQPDR